MEWLGATIVFDGFPMVVGSPVHRVPKVFDGCPPTVKRCDVMDHRSSLKDNIDSVEYIYNDHIEDDDHLKEGTSLGRSHPADSGRAQRNNSSYQNILFWVQINEIRTSTQYLPDMISSLRPDLLTTDFKVC